MWHRFAPAGARIALAGVVFAFVSPVAQAYLTEDQYQELVKVTTELSPLGDNAFGERASLYSGELSFAQTDVDLAGTGPSIVLQRVKDSIGRKASPINGNGAFGDWSLNIPRITTLTPDYSAQQATTPPAPEEWVVDDPSSSTFYSYARCTKIGPPPSGQLFDPQDWWNGYELSTPEAGSSTLLVRHASVPVPTGIVAGSPITNFTGTTTSNWVAGCGVNTANEAAGREGFLVVSPTGVKYWMNWIAYYDTASINMGSDGIPNMPTISTLKRKMAHLSVTRMEDRFGNWLTFSYTGSNLTGISSSDGRVITLTWRFDLPKPVIDYITVQPGPDERTWSYDYAVDQYNQIRLTNATLPDLSQWSFSLSNLDNATLTYSGRFTCDGTTSNFPNPTNLSTTYTGTITHPSGLTGSFTIKPTRHGRSYVPYTCLQTPSSGTNYVYEPAIPNLYDTVSLVSKSYGSSWTYSYGTPNASWSNCTSNCGPGTVETTVTHTDGSKIKHVFSNKYDAKEGKEVGTHTYDVDGSTLLQSIASGYRDFNAGPYPANYGNSYQQRSGPNVNTITPLNLQQITQFTDTYTTAYPDFDEFGQAEQIDASNSIAGQPSTTTILGLRNNYAYWLIGLPETTTINNVQTERTDYDAVSLLPVARHRFGLKYRTLTWDSLGRVTSLKDGLNHTTSLSQHLYGQPRRFDYADGTFATRVLNAFGEVTSVTNEAGNTTGYTRDDMGRITRITYPTGDTQAWVTRDISYTQLTASENGWAAGLWRVEDTEGNYRKRTYYDGLFRPGAIEEKDLATGVTRYQRTLYDHRNNPTHVSFRNSTNTGYGTSFEYDGLGRQTRRNSFLASGTTPLETTAYQSANRRMVTDARGFSTTTTYQAIGAPSYEAAILIEAPEGQTTTINRDVFGNVTLATQSGLYNASPVSVSRSYVYDTNMRLCKRIEPETGQSVMAYDAASNVTWTADAQAGSTSTCDYTSVAAASKTLFGYDARNRVTSANAPGTDADVTTTYWPTGDVKTIANASTWTYNYSKRRLLEDETLTADSINFRLDYNYNAQGVLSQLIYPSNRSLSLSPNAFAQSTAVGTYATAASYHPSGTLKHFTYGNGLAYDLTIDARQRPEHLQVLNGATPRIDLTHGYDTTDNLTAITDAPGSATGGADSRTLGYDGLNRLTSASAPGLWGSYGYAYDPVNNIRARSGPNALTYSYVPEAANRLTTVSGGVTRNYTYNAEGQVTADGSGKTFTWNGADRITNVSGVASYSFDGLGKRFKTTKSGGEIEYTIYSKAGTMLYSYKPGTGEFVDYAYLGSLPVAEIKTVPGGTVAEAMENPPIATVLNLVPNLPPQITDLIQQPEDPTGETQPAQTTTTYLHADLLGSPTQASGSTGNQLWIEHYKPYGEKMNGVAEKLGYTAHVFDGNTGLTYAQARFYDAAVGRFLSTDPVEFDGVNPFTFNRYGYGNNHPYKFVDPDGKLSLVLGAVQKDLPMESAMQVSQAGNTAMAAGGAALVIGADTVTGAKGTAAHALGVVTKAAKAAKTAKAASRTSRTARREATREAGIPTSQQPRSQSQNESGMSYEYDVPKPGGGTEVKSVQQQTLDRSHPGQGHWEAGSVKTDPLTGDVRYNDYGRPQLTNDKVKVEY